MTIAETFARHHQLCDEAYAAAEAAAANKQWEVAGPGFARFRGLLERHFATEEGQLFPAFELKTGAPGGPTSVMRLEHTQMRQLLAEMGEAVAGRDVNAFVGAGETLLVLMQQHNLKEEHILYPMCDEALASDGGLLGALEAALEARG